MEESTVKDLELKISITKQAIKQHPRVTNEVMDPALALVRSAEKFLMAHKLYISGLKEQIQLLKQQNDDYKNDIINKIDSAPKACDYKEALMKPKKDKNITVIAKPREGSDMNSNQIKELICNTINPSDFKCEKIQINRYNVAYKFSDNNSKDKFLSSIASIPSIGNVTEAYEPRPKCPTIILKNLDYSTLESDLIQQLTEQNPHLNLSASNFKFLFSIKKKYHYNAILCVSPHVFHKIVDQTITIGWTATLVEETFLISSCNKCLSFKHRSNSCPLEGNKKCRKCGNIFSTFNRNNQQSDFQVHIKSCNTLKCVNCSEDRFFAHNTHHHSQSDDCPSYSAKLKFTKNNTCYDEQKDIKFFPRVNVQINQRHSTTSNNHQHESN